MPKIHFEINGEGDKSLTQCPYADFLLRVGSRECELCKFHFIMFEHNGKPCVDCLNEEGEFLTMLPSEMKRNERN